MAMQEDTDVPMGTAGRAIEKASPRVVGPFNEVERFFEQRRDQAAWHELPAEVDQTKAETRDGMLETTLAKAAGANSHRMKIA